MQSPSLELVNDCHIYISGEVVVHPGAAIAPGVLLQADPGSQLIIAAGVCIGQGVVLHANQGTLSIEAGATLGSGVLIVGQGQIGANACIGALTTIINGSIAPHQIVPPNSLIGETGRQVEAEPEAKPGEPSDSEALPQPQSFFSQSFFSRTREPEQPQPQAPQNQAAPQSQPISQDQASSHSSFPSPPSSTHPPIHPSTQVYGKAYVERFMITMFPHRQLDGNGSNLNGSDQNGLNQDGSNPSAPDPPT